MFDPPTQQIIPSTRVVRVHLFRHGEVEGRRMCRGHADAPLSAKGHAQSRRIAEWFSPRPDLVISSDLTRCTTLARHLSADVIEVPDLREQDMGAWDGKGWEELTATDPAGVTAYWDDYVNARPPGGESFGECFARVCAWWIAQDFGEKRVVLVTHIGVIRALMCGWLGLGPDQALRWAPAYASHSQVLLAEAGCVIERFGETGFLE